MFRLTIRDMLWLTVVVRLSVPLLAEEPGPTLKQLLRQTEARFDEDRFVAKAVGSQVALHKSPTIGVNRHLLVISWFQGTGSAALEYTVMDTGRSDDSRMVYNWARQAWNRKQISADDLKRLTELLPMLPESKAEPPIERTVHVSFQSGDKWRTETYDAAKLPDEFEMVMLIIGERFETKDRHNKK